MRTSIGSVIVMPTPTAGPLIAAITGLCESKIRSDDARRRRAARRASPRVALAPVEGLAAAAEVGARRRSRGRRR